MKMSIYIWASTRENLSSGFANNKDADQPAASTRENLSSGFANNKDADQPAHPRSLISDFVIRLLESIIYKAIGEVSLF